MDKIAFSFEDAAIMKMDELAASWQEHYEYERYYTICCVGSVS